MNKSDLINGLFEFLGGLLLFRNCYALYLSKEVRGINISTTGFFLLWGIWNIFFYPINGLWLSFSGGLILAIGNLTWVLQAIYYTCKNRKPTAEKTQREWLKLAQQFKNKYN